MQIKSYTAVFITNSTKFETKRFYSYISKNVCIYQTLANLTILAEAMKKAVLSHLFTSYC